MLDKRLVACLFFCLASSFPLAAAPGRFTSAGPFGSMDSGVEDLVFPGSDPRRILIRTSIDLFESRDAGFSWRSVLANFPHIRPVSLAVDPADADRWYVAGEPGPDSRVWQTADAGLSWTALPLPALAASERELRFFVDRFEAANLALEVHFPAQPGYRRFVSRNRGTTWSELDPVGLAADRFEILGLNGGTLYLRQKRFELASGASTALSFDAVSSLIFDRTRPNTLYVAVDEGPFGTLYSSIDRGATLVRLRNFGLSLRFLVQSPWNPSHVASGDADGLYFSLDRGTTWVTLPTAAVRNAAFDPASGELLLAGGELVRRHLDGTLSAPFALHGLLASSIGTLATEGETALAVDLNDRSYIRDENGIWRRRGRLATDASVACRGASRAAFLPGDPRFAVVACGSAILFATTNGGASWARSPFFPPPGAGAFQLAANSSNYYLLADEEIYRSRDFGFSWEMLFIPSGSSGFAVHPDPARGLLALGGTATIGRYPSSANPVVNSFGTAGEAAQGPGQNVDHSPIYPYIPFAHDRAHPELLYLIYGWDLSRSLDFGETWEPVSRMTQALPAPLVWNPELPLSETLIDPFDADHWLLMDRGLETLDGGETFFASEDAFAPAAFDRATPGQFLKGGSGTGVLERSESLPACPDGEEAWCASAGRYLLTVDWKDPQGHSGRATKVLTGSENSGLFYFFDPGNWELLVKVLDGCGLNQRQWVFAAGTTDVEYVLRVEDRWTGQIRHYANQGGQAAAAITDTDAFAGCGAPPPPGAAAQPIGSAGQGEGEPALALLQGRFEVKTRWTDFGGHQGAGLAAPLRSDNSGLFYFFDPDNWEMLVKVLDGCAINNHYWVLAAATTDVGYELSVRDLEGTTTKTYNNPVGRAAPATIDLQAFSCP